MVNIRKGLIEKGLKKMEFHLVNLLYFVITIPIVFITYICILKLNKDNKPLSYVIVLR